MSVYGDPVFNYLSVTRFAMIVWLDFKPLQTLEIDITLHEDFILSNQILNLSIFTFNFANFDQDQLVISTQVF